MRAHVFLCMLAYYVEWHMRRALAPLLFEDHDRAAAQRASVVCKAERSPAADRKAATKRTEDDFAAQSFRSLLGQLGTIVKNWVRPAATPGASFPMVTTPNRHQRRAFELLGLSLRP